MKTMAGWAAGSMGVVALLGGLACAAGKPSPTLLSAREAYGVAEGGPAKELNPADLHDAKVLLDEAEAAVQGDGDAPLATHRAYLALRRAELANAQGRTSAAVREKAVTLQAIQAIKDQSLATARGQLVDAAAQLSQAQKQLDAEHQSGVALHGQLDAEHEARLAAEQKTLDALGTVADVRREARGLVISLSGSVLFGSGKSELLPSAQRRLDQVAEALKSSDRTILIEGHTDSRGSTGLNQQLSQNRAQSVMDYLVPRGILVQRVRAVGLGASRPIAENTSAEGRANNRRVEIVIESPPAKVN